MSDTPPLPHQCPQHPQHPQQTPFLLGFSRVIIRNIPPHKRHIKTPPHHQAGAQTGVAHPPAG